MKKIFVAAVIMLMACAVFGKSYIPDYAKDEIMTCDKIQRGMEGYGLTVFSGITIEKFNFKVLGVIKGFNRGKDVIYVELDHPRLNKSMSGVLHGMSGSPCYIDGKLIGAVALGYTFPKENTCMLTTIEDMFETWDPNVEKQGEGTKIQTGDRSAFAVPLSVSGLTPATQKLLKDSMRIKGYDMFAGGGKASSLNFPDADKATLEPGAAVSSVLIDGDIVAASTGTVTYRHGNKLLAYGHPMNEIGKTEVPMATAWIVDIFSSTESSSKICNALEVKGTVYQDRSFAIAGEIGRKAKVCPVHVHVKDLTTKREQNLNCTVPANHTYFYDFAPIVILEGLNRCRVGQTPTTGKFTYKITLEDNTEFEFSNIYTHQYSVAGQVAEQLVSVCDKLMNSKYGIQDVKSIDVEGEVCDGNKFAFIERVFLDKNTYKPGDTMTVGIEMRKFASKDTYTEYKTVKIPANAEPGKMGILIYGGVLGEAVQLSKKEPSNSVVVGVEKDTTTSFAQYFNDYLEFDRNSQLVIKLIEEKGSTLVAKGEKLKDLPDYMKMLFSNTNNSVISSEPREYKTVFETETIPLGLAAISVPVDKEIKTQILDSEAKPLSAMAKVLNFDMTSDFSDFKVYAKEIAQLTGELEEAIKVTSEDVKSLNIPSEYSADKEKETAKTEKKEEKKEEKKSSEKIVSSIKKPLSLVFKDEKDFSKGTYTNCNFSNGKILPTVKFNKTIYAKDQLVSSIAKTDLGYIAGFGLDCGVAFINTADDSLSETSPLEGLWVSSICQVGKNVYVATNPGANIYRITKGTKPVCEKLSFKTEHKYISKMAAFDNKLLVGFSDSGEVVLLDENMKTVKKVFHGGAFTADFAVYGSQVYAGCKNKIVSLDKKLNVRTVMGNPGGTVTTLTVSSKGDLYAFIDTKNIIVKINGEGIEKTVPKAGEMFTSYTDGKDTVFFAGKDTVLKIYGNGDYVSDRYTKEASQFSAIAGEGDTAYIASTNPGSIFKTVLHPKKCYYSSPVLTFGCDVEVKDIEIPMKNASVTVGKKLATAKSPQKFGKSDNFSFYVVFFESENMEDFNKVTLKYYMPNRAPQVKIASPETNAVFAGKKKIEWTVTEPDKDNYSVRIVAVNQKTKQETQLYPNEKQKAEPDKEPVKSYEIDTKVLEDGIYDIKVIADDTLTNGNKGKTGEDTVSGIKVINSLPHIEICSVDVKGEDNKTIYFAGKVSGENILGVEYSDGGQFVSVPVNIHGEFSLTVPAKKGNISYTFRVVDEAGNHDETSINAKTE